MEQVRMGNVGKESAVHTLDHLIHITLQNAGILRRPAAVRLVDLITNKMLAHQQIINGKIPKNRKQLGQ